VIIAVIGGEQATARDEAAAYSVGMEIGRRGHVLICGGRGGVTREACRGARESGAHTIGILPGGDRSEANPFVEFSIVTGMGEMRNVIIARSADAVVALGGRYGTLSEIAFAFIEGKPVASLASWALTLPDGQAAPIVPCASAADALDYCERAYRKE
jgi:uncharacterized protein (TIGR00725 family)